MNKYYTYFIGGGVFFVACIVAYFITSLLVGKGASSGSDDDSPVTYANVSSKSVTDSVTTIKQQIKTKKKVVPEIFVISKEKVGNTYTLQVSCINVPKGTSVYYRIDVLGKYSNDGTFTNIAGCKTGKYVVEAYDKASNSFIVGLEIDGFVLSPEDQPVQKMSAAEFQRLLLNQNDNSLLGGKNPRVARYVNITCVGLHEDDFPAGDIQHLRDKIANGIWRSAVVSSVGYNERGQINAATIRPVYDE